MGGIFVGWYVGECRGTFDWDVGNIIGWIIGDLVGVIDAIFVGYIVSMFDE